MKHHYKCYYKYVVISRVLFAILILFYIITNFSSHIGLPSQLTNFKIMPTLWIILSFVILFFLPKVHPLGKKVQTDNIIFEALICAVVYIALQFIAGIIIDTLGKSPYDHTINGMFNNFLYAIIPAIGRELIRAYLLNTYCIRKNNKAFIIITTVFIMIELGSIKVANLTSLKGFVVYASQTVGPAISINILLSLFALYGGSKPAILIITLITGFHWFSPILPDLKWLTAGAIGITVPTFECLIFFEKYKIRYENIKHSEDIQKINIGTFISFGLTVTLLWFIVGVFPVYPSVIATGSMIPVVYPGDIILIKKATVEADIFNLKTGDVITFDRDGIIITHRIKEIIKDDNGNLTFKTRGDNNSADDARLVQPNEIKGTLNGIIPKIGYLTLWLKSEKLPDDDIEF